MVIDKSKITGTRFMFSVAFYLQSSALLTAFLAGVTMHESWIPVIFGTVISIPMIYMFRTFMVMFPDKNFLQILEEVYGKVIGKILGAGMLWFYLHLASLNVMDLGNFIQITFLPETPSLFTTGCCLFLCVWAVRHGFGVVGRYSTLFTFVEFLIVAISIVFLINQIKLVNFLPLFSLETIKYVQATHIITVIPIGEIMVFLMVMPCVKSLTPRETTKYWFLGATMGIFVLLAVLLRDIGILGNTLHFFNLPGLVSMRLVNMGDALSRMEIIFAVGIMMLLFFKIAVLVYVTTIALAQLFGTLQYKNLALVTAALVLFYSPTLYPNGIEHTQTARSYEPFSHSIFEIIIPLLTLIVAKIRKLPSSRKKEEGKNEKEIKEVKEAAEEGGA